MIFRQFVHDDLGCASYLVGDAAARVAAVVDPKLEVDDYLELARFLDVEIRHVLETHNHADHVSGHGRLADATGATIHIHELASAEYPHHGFSDGWQLELGEVVVEAIHVPGHRPEHTAFALRDRSRAADPWALLSGDSLFVGDVARADLAVDAEEGARLMFRSLHDRLLTLPDSCEVWPGHLGGSLCGGAAVSMKPSSTLGFERAYNSALAIRDEDEFVAEAIAGLAPQPPNFSHVVGINRGPFRVDPILPVALTPRQVSREQERGALVVDVRTDAEFDEAHIPGAVCVPTSAAGFGSKLGWLAGDATTVILIGRDDAEGAAATQLAAAVGIDSARYFLDGGMSAWRQERRPTRSLARIDIATLHERIADLQVLDVRGEREWRTGSIPGAVNTPYHAIAGIPDGIDPELPVAVVCATGARSAIAASLLRRHGVGEVLHVAEGGVSTWRARGWPIATP